MNKIEQIKTKSSYEEEKEAQVVNLEFDDDDPIEQIIKSWAYPIIIVNYMNKYF